MSELLLKSLEIKGYRCFEHLTIEKLGHVNLIVGKNNIGKTALLEALWIYANHNDENIFTYILLNRNEIAGGSNGPYDPSRYQSDAAKRNFFFKRPNTPDKNDKSPYPYFVISGAESDFFDYAVKRIMEHSRNNSDEPLEKTLIESLGAKTTVAEYFYNFNRSGPSIEFLPNVYRNINNLFVGLSGLSPEKMVEYWDKITLTPTEDDVIKALQILLPELKRIDFIGYPSGTPNRVPVVRLSNEEERLPLKSFGEGMIRLLGISMALAQCKDGIILIDEIESGLHYAALPDIWNLIFEVSQKLNIQVFATTHSNDCVKSFATAAERSSNEGTLIRLERQGEKIVAKTIEEARLINAVNYEVEVR